MRVRRRGVAQIEFVAGMPLVMTVAALVVFGSVLVLGAVSRSSSTGAGKATPGAAGAGSQGAEGAGTGMTAAESCDVARPSLQVPHRFRVLGDGQAVTRVQPIARLGRAGGK